MEVNMKKLVFLVLAFFAFGALKSIVVKYQIQEAKMVVANQESGTYDPTDPGKS
jgi:hypothetical protein